jgi:tyrosyl-tRNA synthetase
VFGHHVIALAGEGTGMIGIPAEDLQKKHAITEEAHHNVEEIKKTARSFFGF